MAYLPSDNPTSLVAWFRMGVGITIDGAGVSVWADQSGNGNDLLQGTDGNRPAYDGSAIITFDGVDNFLKCATFTLNQPEQVSILASQIAWTGNDYLFDGNTTNTMGMIQTGATPSVSIVAGSIVAANTDMTLGSFFAVTSLFNGAGSSITVGSGTPTTGDVGAANAAGFTLGVRGAASLRFSNIAVKEIIIRNVDDATIRAADHQYLIDLENPPTPPVADFSGTPLSGTAPVSVEFTDLSTESPTSWLWDFGDGDSSTDQNPTHEYDTAGTYTVTLTATNAGGSDQEVKTNYITVSTPATDTTTPQGGGGHHPSQGKGYTGHEVRRRTKEDIRRDREKFGVIPKQVERIIEEVAQRQASRDEQDKQKQYDELLGELKLQNLELEARYLEALALQREVFIEDKLEEMRLRKVQILALLLMAAST